MNSSENVTSENIPQGIAEYARKIDHVAIAVRDLEKSIIFYARLGFALTERMTTRGSESGMVSAVMMAGPVKFVLLQGTDENSQITRFINEFGPGAQHIAIEVENCEAVCDALESNGLPFNTKIIKGPGLTQRFTQRCPESGVMLEFIERNETTEGFSEQNVSDLFKQLEDNDTF